MPGKRCASSPANVSSIESSAPACPVGALVRAAVETAAAPADQVVAVVALGLDPELVRVIRDDRSRGAERVRRPEAPGLAARERERHDAAEAARELVGPRPAGDDHDLGARARAVAQPQRPALAVGSQAVTRVPRRIVAPSRSAARTKPSATNSGCAWPPVGS